MHLYILFHTGFHYGFSQDVECSSLCCTVGPSLFLMRNSCIFFFSCWKKIYQWPLPLQIQFRQMPKISCKGASYCFFPFTLFFFLGVFDANAWFPSCALSLKEPQGGPSLVPDLLSAHQSWREVGGVDPVLIFSRFKV